jgi:hypothetical protein
MRAIVPATVAVALATPFAAASGRQATAVVLLLATIVGVWWWLLAPTCRNYEARARWNRAVARARVGQWATITNFRPSATEWAACVITGAPRYGRIIPTIAEHPLHRMPLTDQPCPLLILGGDTLPPMPPGASTTTFGLLSPGVTATLWWTDRSWSRHPEGVRRCIRGPITDVDASSGDLVFTVGGVPISAGEITGIHVHSDADVAVR